MGAFSIALVGQVLSWKFITGYFLYFVQLIATSSFRNNNFENKKPLRLKIETEGLTSAVPLLFIPKWNTLRRISAAVPVPERMNSGIHSRAIKNLRQKRRRANYHSFAPDTGCTDILPL